MNAYKSTRTKDNYQVSAIVSTYNSEEFIEGCLQDLLAQTLYKKGDLEIVIIDSASEQNEKKIIEQYQEKHPHIVYQRTDQRETLYAAWNRGIKLSKGKYITNANTDDRHHPQGLERLAQGLDRDPKNMLAYSHCKVSKTPNQNFQECPADIVYRYPEYFPPLCLLYYMFGPQPMWKREVHNLIGYFDPSLSAVGDLDFNIRFCLSGLKAVLVPEVLGSFLYSKSSITSSYPLQAQEKSRVMEKYRTPENALFLYSWADKLINESRHKAKILNEFAIQALDYFTPWGRRESLPKFAMRCFAKALEFEPYSENIRNNLKLVKELRNKNDTSLNIIDQIKSHNKSEEGIDSLDDSVANDEADSTSIADSTSEHITISFFTGPNDHFHFAEPIITHFQKQGICVRKVTSKDIQEQGLGYFLENSDLAWFEWGNGYIVEASRLPKKCPLICRIHRFEIFQPRMREVLWENVDHVIFINKNFVDIFNQLSGIDLFSITQISEIPNPLTASEVFHERTPGFNIAHVSRFHADKNPLMALEILSELVTLDSRYKLFMIGKVQDMQLFHSCMDFAKKAGLQNHFIYEGIKNNVENWLLNKSFILSTSIVESQGMALLEAMCQGIKPIIYSGFGLEKTFPPEYLFLKTKEAVQLISTGEYDSNRYREEASSLFGNETIFPKIDDLLFSLLPKQKHAKNNPAESNAESTTSVAKHPCLLEKQLDQKGWTHKKNLYSKYFDYVTSNNISSPKMSIIVISWRLHLDTIKNFQILEKQRNQNFELIFVDNGGQPGEFDELKPYIDTYVRLSTNTGAYLARNIGAVFANAPFLFFLEDDGIPAENLIEEHLKAHSKYNVYAVRGIYRFKTKNPLNTNQKHYYLGSQPYPRFGDLEGNISYEANIFYQAGGWDDNILFGHGGIDLSYRLLKIDSDMRKQIYYPNAIIFHDYATDQNHLVTKRRKQAQTWQYLKKKHGHNFDHFIRSWDSFKRQKDLIMPREKSSKNKKSFFNLAEHYRRQGNEQKYKYYQKKALETNIFE